MATSKTASLTVNEISMTWNERSRRIDKPCDKCGAPTKGRMVNVGGISRPAHSSCAMSLTMEKAVRFYARVAPDA